MQHNEECPIFWNLLLRFIHHFQIPLKDYSLTVIWANRNSYFYLEIMNLHQFKQVVNLGFELYFKKEATISKFLYKIKLTVHLNIKDLLADEGVNIQKRLAFIQASDSLAFSVEIVLSRQSLAGIPLFVVDLVLGRSWVAPLP